MINFLKNYFGTLFFIAFWYIFYTSNEYYRGVFTGRLSLDFIDFQINIPTIFLIIIFLYIVFLVPFYATYTKKSKGRIVLNYFWKVIKGNTLYSQEEKTALLAWIVKLFFAPLMIMWLSKHIFNMSNNIYHTLQNISLFSSDFLLFFNNNFFWMAFTIILFTDVFFFTMGYLIEMPALKNTIKSVEPTFIWWAVAIFCYPPFNTHVTNLIGWYSTDFPHFSNIYIHIILNILLLILMWIYSRASFSLWFKASNLTNRWIVTNWPYKYVRHPAYICKNTAWLIWGIPMIYIALTTDNRNIFAVLLWLLWWAFMYYTRLQGNRY